jgi:hydroxymethylbilane synthase
MTTRLVVATRKSLLALTQTRAFVAMLVERHPGLAIEELQVTTTGDLIQHVPLNEVGGKGLFVKEIEQALLDGRADFAVHSMKDVPAELASGLTIACVPAREDPRDALVTRSGVGLDALHEGATIGSSSLRRTAQIRALRPDFRWSMLRGNVDTRIRRCHEGVVDAVVLAMAGLNRLGWGNRATEAIAVERCLPAVGQGALAIECRAADPRTRELLGAVSDAEASRCVMVERGVQQAIGGGCHVPLAAYSERQGEQIWVRALLAGANGEIWRRERIAPWPVDDDAALTLGIEMGRELLEASTKAV